MEKITLHQIILSEINTLSLNITLTKSFDKNYILINRNITLIKNAPLLDKFNIHENLYGIILLNVYENNITLGEYFPVIYNINGEIIVDVYGFLESISINVNTMPSDTLFELIPQNIYFFRPTKIPKVERTVINTESGNFILKTENLYGYTIYLTSTYPNGIPIEAKSYIKIKDTNIINAPRQYIGLARAFALNYGIVYVECLLLNNNVYIYNDIKITGIRNTKILIPDQELIFV